MKKLSVLFLVILGVLTVCVCSVYASSDISVDVNGQLIDFPDAKPFIDANGRTLIPVRFVSEALGADVIWNGELKEVGINLGSTEISVRIGDKTIIVNGESKQMDTEPTIAMDRTYVPVRFVAEGLGATVGWDGETKTVSVTTASNLNLVDFSLIVNVLLEIEPQYEEVEGFLTENAGEELTKQIMSYVKLKTKITDALEEKIWEWGDKNIYVTSNANVPYIKINAK